MRAVLLLLIALGVCAAGYFVLELDPTAEDAPLEGLGETPEEDSTGAADLVGRGTAVESGEAIAIERPTGRYVVEGTLASLLEIERGDIEILAEYMSPAGTKRDAEDARWETLEARLRRRAAGLRVPPRGEGRFAASTRSREDGTFSLDVRRTGMFRITARPVGSLVASYANVQVTSTAPKPTCTLHLGEGRPLTGTVKTASGTPVPAVVEAFAGPKGSDFPHAWMGPRVRADAAGTFTMAGAPVGDLTFTVTLPGRWQLIGVKAKHEADKPVELIVGEGTSTMYGTVRSDGEHSVRGADVIVMVAFSTEGEDRTLSAAARTSNDGTWRIEGIPSGRVRRVEATAPGFVALQQSPPLAPWAPLTLEDGKEHKLDLQLVRGGTVRGRITDEKTGAPLAGVAVGLNMTTTPPGEPSVRPPFATTNAAGVYLLEGVRAGGYSVVASHDTHYLAALVRAQSPPTSDDKTKAPRRRTRFGNPDLILVMPPEGGEVERDLAMRQGREVQGTVTGPEGPIEGAPVTISSGLQNHSIRNVPGIAPAPILSDAEGRWSAKGLPPGSGYRFTAMPQGFICKPTEAIDIPETGEVPSVEIKVEIGATVRGTVVNEDGEPVPSATVMFWTNQSRGYANSNRNQTTTGADGTFEIVGLAPGDYRHWGMAPGGSWKQGQGPKGVELGMVLSDIEITVAGVAEDKPKTTLKGRLVTPDGEPIPETQVQVSTPGQSRRSWSSRTNGAGIFTLTGMDADARYKVRVQFLGSWKDAAEDVAFAEDKATDVKFDSPPTRILEGRVVGPDGQLVPMFEYRLTSGEGTTRTTNPGMPIPGNFDQPWRNGRRRSNAAQAVNGTFRIQVGGDGPWKIKVGKARDAHGQPLGLAELEREITPRDPSPVEWKLHEGEILRGRVTDLRGRPVPEVSISTTQNEVLTASDGSFALAGVEGKTRINIGVPPGFVAAPSREVTPDGTPVVIEIEEGLGVSGRVFDADGNPLGAAWVQANWQKGEGFARGNRSARSDPNGAFKLAGIPSKAKVNLTVNSGKAGSAPFSKPDVLPGTNGLEIRLAAGAEVTGRVLQANGDPATSGYVQLQPKQGGQWAWGQITSGGEFKVTNAPPGKYTLHVQLQGSINQRHTFGEIEAPSSGHTITMPVQHKLEGRISSSESGWGIRAWRMVGSKSESKWGRVRNGSEFSITVGEGEAPWTLIATNTRTNEYAILEGVSGSDSGVKISPVPGDTISGRVLNKDGNPVNRARVRLNAANLPYGWNGSVRTDSDGNFTLKALPSGDFNLTVSSGNLGGKVPPYKARSGESGIVLQAVAKTD